MRRRLRNQPWVFWGERMRRQTTWWKKLLQNKLTQPIRHAAAIAAIGSRAAEDYQHRFPSVPVVSIPYHCDLSAFQTAATDKEISEDAPFTFLFCGQMIARKGLDILVQAFAQLVASTEHVRLILVGREAELDQCLAGVSSPVADRIENRGFKAPDDLPAEFARADVFVLPSRYDGWGVVVNQALGAGLPVICSDAVGAGVDLVTHGENGQIFTSGDVHSLTQAMKALTADPVRARAWGENSLARSGKWTPVCGAQRWLKLIKEVLSR